MHTPPETDVVPCRNVLSDAQINIEYRDALAHRIPLYIPPGGVKPKHVQAYNELSRRMTEALYVKQNGFEYNRLSAEQERLLTFR